MRRPAGSVRSTDGRCCPRWLAICASRLHQHPAMKRQRGARRRRSTSKSRCSVVSTAASARLLPGLLQLLSVSHLVMYFVNLLLLFHYHSRKTGPLLSFDALSATLLPAPDDFSALSRMFLVWNFTLVCGPEIPAAVAAVVTTHCSCHRLSHSAPSAPPHIARPRSRVPPTLHHMAVDAR